MQSLFAIQSVICITHYRTCSKDFCLISVDKGKGEFTHRRIEHSLLLNSFSLNSLEYEYFYPSLVFQYDLLSKVDCSLLLVHFLNYCSFSYLLDFRFFDTLSCKWTLILTFGNWLINNGKKWIKQYWRVGIK